MDTLAVAPPLLEFRDVEVYYDQAILALRGVSLKVDEGSIVALLGPNGAGKSTTLRAGLGLLHAERGAVTRGDVRYRGERINDWSARRRVLSGLAEVLEGRHCFPHLTVEENLASGLLVDGAGRAETRRRLERIYSYFPGLRDKRRLAAGYTSGGEQQMIALGRALIREPRLVLLDEPSMGLAPKVVHEIFELVHDLNRREGIAFLLAEQNAHLALKYARYGYVLDNGRVLSEGRSEDLAQRADIRELYLGSREIRKRRSLAHAESPH